jgi:DNA-binding transcriptional ArsR family regulator
VVKENIGKLLIRNHYEENKMNTSSMNQDELLKFMKSLSDARRLKIAGLLGVEALTPTQVAERLGMKSDEVENQLEQLVVAGLARKEGNAYRLDNQALEKLTHRVLAQSRPPAPEYEGDEFEVKTLRAYISRDGTLKSIPSQHKKLMVILNHLVKNFEPGVQYPESQVNQTLRRYHEDTAALRRYMVDNGLLQREKGIYWRSET